MTDKEIKDLIRLKRYEKPSEGYFDEFLLDFQQRQRSEMLNTSARYLLLERMKTWLSELGAMRYLMGAGVAYAVLALILNVLPDQLAVDSEVTATEKDVDVMILEDDTLSTVSNISVDLFSAEENTPVSMVFSGPVDFSSPAPVFFAEEQIF